MATRAVRGGGDWPISGTKMFITNGTWAKVALTFARSRRRRDHRVPGAHRQPRPHGDGGPRQARPARPSHRRTGLRRGPRPRHRPSRRRRPRPRHRDGRMTAAASRWRRRGGRRPGFGGRGGAVRDRAHPVRKAHRLVPARAGTAGRFRGGRPGIAAAHPPGRTHG
ncbi:hypothetical protein ACU686_42760 [Yinghuangia aomiensis]